MTNKLIDQGTWTEPPEGVSDAMWASAILGGYCDRFERIKRPTPTKEEYEIIKRELYGDYPN